MLACVKTFFIFQHIYLKGASMFVCGNFFHFLKNQIQNSSYPCRTLNNNSLEKTYQCLKEQ